MPEEEKKAVNNTSRDEICRAYDEEHSKRVARIGTLGSKDLRV
jgi:hypothetical protein